MKFFFKQFSFIFLGFASMTVPIYIAEAVPPENRGSFVTTYEIMGAVGFFFASLVNSFFSYLGGQSWR